MDLQKFDEYLKNRYYDQLFYYKGASRKNQKNYKNFQWTIIIISTVTTILAALPRSENFNTQYLVVITAALVTILTAGLKTFQYQELWITYRNTSEQLKPEIFYYEFNVGDYGQPDIDKESLFVTRVEAILSKEHDSWPMFKQLTNKEGKQQADDLQKKLDELAREQFNTQKSPPAAGAVVADGTASDTVGELTDTDADPSNTEGDVPTSAEPSTDENIASVEGGDITQSDEPMIDENDPRMEPQG